MLYHICIVNAIYTTLLIPGGSTQMHNYNNYNYYIFISVLCEGAAENHTLHAILLYIML